MSNTMPLATRGLKLQPKEGPPDEPVEGRNASTFWITECVS